MKNSILAASILSITAATVVLFPAVKDTFAKQPIKPAPTLPVKNEPAKIGSIKEIANQNPKIEVVFVLDTTGSMSGLIQAAKEKIWSIASTMASAQNAPDIKMGLVAYRDRGDAYITQTVPLSSDLDSMYSKLMDFKAGGGGDGPESVNQGLYDAVHKIAWSQDNKVYKVVFLIGDAPAHMDYQDDVKYPETIAYAQKHGIIINAIQSGKNSATTKNWQTIASLGQGDFFQVENNGSAVAIATPFDKELAALSVELDDTRIFYGNKEAKLKQRNKIAASSKIYRQSSDTSLARRAAYNISKSGRHNFLGEGELVDAVSEGKASLSSIATEELPVEMQVMSNKAREEYVAEKSEKRKVLKEKITQLAKKRDDFLKKEVAKVGADKDSLDARIFGAIRSQAKDKGLMYDAASAKY